LFLLKSMISPNFKDSLSLRKLAYVQLITHPSFSHPRTHPPNGHHQLPDFLSF